ncbi:MAG: amino acid ABC transporter ATP-binding protein [Clostridia bacterium]|nr:amino acid ABC transporter ATP-binding protein [Clostridia bacterium]
MAFLEVCDLRKCFGETEVLKGVSFTMEKGEVISVIGSSGNGKTTLLRCLNFLETPDDGTITVGGKRVFPVATEEEKTGGNRLTFGLVFQNFNLFPQYNALRNVTLAMDIKDENELRAAGVKSKERKAILKQRKADNVQTATALLERVGLKDKLLNYPCELSGGQQQRVAIARALALSPDILCFDEPTSALDPELTGEVLKVIKGLIDEDRTIIIVTHEMGFARNVSDKIIFMADGVIEETGTPEEVFDAPKSEKTRAFFAKATEKE